MAARDTGGSEMDCLWGVWGELGCAFVDGGLENEWGVLMGVDNVVSAMDRV